MLTIQTFQAQLHRLNIPISQNGFLLAISGGADSMVLLHLFHEAGISFQVAHVNYGLRGEDSDADENLVRNYCLTNNIRFHQYTVSKKDQKPAGSIQLWARDLRYRFFRQIQQKENLRYLVTAHHLNDQLETFLINLSRGTGIRGLCGITEITDDIVRPLLHFSKEEIYSFAEDNKIPFREDISNAKNDYLRNRIRNEVISKLTDARPDFLENFDKSISYLYETNNFVDEKIAEIEQVLIQENPTGFKIDKAGLQKESDFVKFEILRKFGFSNKSEISKVFLAEKGKVFQSASFELTVDREILALRTLHGSTAAENLEFILETDHDQILIPDSVIGTFTKDSNTNWYFDRQKLTLPLKLRRKKSGEVFYPIGMIGKKKISKFFKDEKLPILAAQEIWLLCDSKDEVLGVLPLRQDRRHVADAETSHVLTLNF